MDLVIQELASSLKPGMVHAWLFDIEDLQGRAQNFEKLLGKKEIARANSYYFEVDRVRFVIRRGILRLLLHGYTGLNPASIAYEVNQFGKLSCSSARYKINSSHSQNRIAFAITLEQDIGVDIEQERQLPDFLHMAEAYFSAAEINYLASLNPAGKMSAFYHIWTQKEAVIKAQGYGFTMPTREFSVAVDPMRLNVLVDIDGNNSSPWRVISFQPDPGWWAAVCVPTEKPLEVIHFRPGLQDFLQTFYP